MTSDQGGDEQGAVGSPGPERWNGPWLRLPHEQRQWRHSPAAALCIVAGAGSGKTRVLTLRATRRIADGSVEADHTAIFTFTRRAAHELRQRLRGYGVPVSSPTGEGIPTRGVRAGPFTSWPWPSSAVTPSTGVAHPRWWPSAVFG